MSVSIINKYVRESWEYLVGVKMTANMPNGSSAHFCKIGTAKEMVFPEPVLEPPIQSRPTPNDTSKQCSQINRVIRPLILMSQKQPN